ILAFGRGSRAREAHHRGQREGQGRGPRLVRGRRQDDRCPGGGARRAPARAPLCDPGADIEREETMKRFCTATLALLVSGCAGPGGPAADARVPSNPDTVVWGYLPAGRAPVLTVRSGQTVEIDTVSHQGLINGTDPVSFFGAQGVQANE